MPPPSPVGAMHDDQPAWAAAMVSVARQAWKAATSKMLMMTARRADGMGLRIYLDPLRYLPPRAAAPVEIAGDPGNRRAEDGKDQQAVEDIVAVFLEEGF